MGIYDIQLERTGATADWSLFVLCAIAAVLGLIAAIVVIPQLLAAVRRERPVAAGGRPARAGVRADRPGGGADRDAAREVAAGVERAAAGNRVGLSMAALLSAILLVGGIAGSVVALTATGLYHASGHVEATGVVDGRRWLKIAEMPFAVAWNGDELQDGDRVGAACTEGSDVTGLDWTCAPPGH